MTAEDLRSGKGFCIPEKLHSEHIWSTIFPQLRKNVTHSVLTVSEHGEGVSSVCMDRQMLIRRFYKFYASCSSPLLNGAWRTCPFSYR